MRILILLALGAVSVSNLAWAQESFPDDPGMQAWVDRLENPALRESCANDLRWATEIAKRRQQGENSSLLLHWAEQEAERSAASVSARDKDATSIGTAMYLTKLLMHALYDGPIYARIHGGFPQWAYRSCLKNKPLGL